MIRRLINAAAFAVVVHQLHQLKGLVMSASDDVRAVTAQLGKVRTEFTTAIASLEQKIVDGTVEASDLDALKAAAQGLDDLNPDPAPEPEPPVEEPAPAEPVEEPAPGDTE